MENSQALEDKFWVTLASDKILMLGLTNLDDSHARPMTAQLEHERRDAIWFFSNNEAELIKDLSLSTKGFATFASADEKLFASILGQVSVETDSGVLDRLWTTEVARWYPGGKTDPNLVLLRFNLSQAEIWASGSSLVNGIKMLFGADPKTVYTDNVTEVNFTR